MQTTDGSSLPKVNVVVDAAEPSLSSNMAAELRAKRAASSVALFATEAMAAAKKMDAQVDASAASFLAEQTTDGSKLPKVNVVVNAAEPSLSSNMGAELRVARAVSSLGLLASEAVAAAKIMKAK